MWIACGALLENHKAAPSARAARAPLVEAIVTPTPLSGVDRRGHSFLSTNEQLLRRYAACSTSVEVLAVQAEHLEAMQADHDRAAARKGACASSGNTA